MLAGDSGAVQGAQDDDTPISDAAEAVGGAFASVFGGGRVAPEGQFIPEREASNVEIVKGVRDQEDIGAPFHLNETKHHTQRFDSNYDTRSSVQLMGAGAMQGVIPSTAGEDAFDPDAPDAPSGGAGSGSNVGKRNAQDDRQRDDVIRRRLDAGLPSNVPTAGEVGATTEAARAAGLASGGSGSGLLTGDASALTARAFNWYFDPSMRSPVYKAMHEESANLYLQKEDYGALMDNYIHLGGGQVAIKEDVRSAAGPNPSAAAVDIIARVGGLMRVKQLRANNAGNPDSGLREYLEIRQLARAVSRYQGDSAGQYQHVAGSLSGLVNSAAKAATRSFLGPGQTPGGESSGFSAQQARGVQDIVREGVTAAGSIAGGLFGATAAGPAGLAPGAAAGAAAGSIAGDALFPNVVPATSRGGTKQAMQDLNAVGLHGSMIPEARFNLGDSDMIKLRPAADTLWGSMADKPPAPEAVQTLDFFA